MANRRMYTDEERARAHAALVINDGNIARAARETGLPESSIRDWKKKWEKEGVPAEIQAYAAGEANVFVIKAQEVRDEALTRLHEKLPDARVGELTTVIGVLDDKISRARMLEKPPPPESSKIDARAAGELLAGFVAEAINQSEERRSAVHQQATENTPKPALPATT